MTITEARLIPIRAKQIAAPRLTAHERAAEIETMARAKGVSLLSRWLTLRAVAHRSLQGDDDALWAAWMRAEAAVLVFDRAKVSDREYQAVRQEKRDAIRALIHGDGPAYDGGGAA